jgi:uncharacterized membrane protein
MGDFTSSTQVAAGEQELFDYLSDVSNLPRYFARMKSAELTGPEEVDTEAEVNGQTVQGKAWFRVDQERKHIEWGSEGESHYSGQIDVTGDTGQSTVTFRMHTERVGDGDEQVTSGIDDTLAQIKQLVEGGSGR